MLKTLRLWWLKYVSVNFIVIDRNDCVDPVYINHFLSWVFCWASRKKTSVKYISKYKALFTSAFLYWSLIITGLGMSLTPDMWHTIIQISYYSCIYRQTSNISCTKSRREDSSCDIISHKDELSYHIQIDKIDREHTHQKMESVINLLEPDQDQFSI